MKHFPRTHLILAMTLAVSLALVLLVSARQADSAALVVSHVPVTALGEGGPVSGWSMPPATPVPAPIPAPIPAPDLIPAPELPIDQAPDPITATDTDHPTAEEAQAADTPALRTEVVRPGDSMARIFARQGLSSRTLHQLVNSSPQARRLQQILPGQTLLFEVDANNQLLRLTLVIDQLTRLEFSASDAGFTASEIRQEPKRVLSFRQGQIDSSLFLAGQAVGLDEATILRFAQIFQWDIDFVMDIRAGDKFSLLFEERYLDDERIGTGAILAAEFINRGRVYRAVRYTNANGATSYYTPDGNSMRKAFLRAPLEFTRVSSGFNPQRLHPIHNRVMPHRGIDYAAPTGTPIMAAGDGRVVTASRTNANGNYIVLQHGEQFQTRYLHLSRFARGISAGARVSQGQVIGYVGATGWATAPHLHYEFLVNGVHRNPATVPLPNAEPVPRAELAQFRVQSAPLLAMLESEKQLLQLASAQ